MGFIDRYSCTVASNSSEDNNKSEIQELCETIL